MGEAQRDSISGGQTDDTEFRTRRNGGPRNPDGTWMAGVVRGPIGGWPFPIGARFGALVIIRYEPYWTKKGKAAGWHPICRCDCGWEGRVDRHNIKAGRSTACNACAKVKSYTKRYWKYKSVLFDDAHRTRLLNRLSSCIGRCHNPRNSAYESYGARGIEVAQIWRDDRAEFLRYIQTLPGWDVPQLEFDRINVNDGYVPGNVRFVTKSENLKNKRRPNDLSQRIIELERELARLRSAQLRPKSSVYGDDNERPDDRS